MHVILSSGFQSIKWYGYLPYHDEEMNCRWCHQRPQQQTEMKIIPVWITVFFKRFIFSADIHLSVTNILLMELINSTVTALRGVRLFVHKGHQRDTFFIGVIISSWWFVMEIPWSRGFVAKLMVAQLGKDISGFYAARMFITFCT
jgi:hypothetical protein